MNSVFSVLSLICLINYSHCYLIFPKTTVFQITASLSVPVHVPNHKIYVDWGFQMNYDLPSNLTHFYSVPTWPGIYNKREAKDIDRSKYQVHDEVHSNDFTAGELYTGLEDLLVSYGLHETCLMKSVCELAKHPFPDEEENLITEIITFILSPSMHEAFGSKELIYKEVYEESEQQGFLGRSCDKLYPLCDKDFLSIISKIITNKEITD